MGLADFKRLQRSGSNVGKLRERQLLLEELASQSPGGVPEERGPGILARVVDILSRPNFAIAGAAEETFSRRGGGIGAAPGRFVREFLSGIGGLQGDKEAFGEVLRQAGVGTGGQLSNVLPGLFSATGKGPAFQRGGLFDITPRGTLGLGLDIATDPLTLIGAGGAGRLTRVGRIALKETAESTRRKFIERATRVTSQKKATIEAFAEGAADRLARTRIASRIAAGEIDLISRGGIKFAGQTLVAGETLARPARFAQRRVVGVLEGSSPGRFVLETGRTLSDSIDRLFHRDPSRLRAIPKAVRTKQKFIDEMRAGHVILRNGIRADGWLKVPQAIGDLIVRHVDDPARFPLEKIPKEFHGLVQKFRTQTAEMFQEEVKRGLIGADKFRENYAPHFYENTAEQVAKVQRLRNPEFAPPIAKLGRHVEERTFDTIEDAVQFSKRMKAEGKIGFELKPIINPSELLWIRGRTSINAIKGDEFFKSLRSQFGKKTATDLDVTLPGVRKFLEDATEKVSPAELDNMARMIDADRVLTKGEIRKLSPSSRAAYLQARFARVRSIRELTDLFNKAKSLFDEIDPDLLENVRKFTDTTTLENAISPWGEAYAKVPTSVDIPQLRGWELPQPIMEDVVNFHKTFLNKKEAATFIRAFDALNNTFKMAVTTLFPAFHFRNAYSNVSQAFTDIGLQALNPKLHLDAVGVMAGFEGTFQGLTRRYTYDELRQVARQRGILIDASHLAEIVGNDKLKRNIITAPGRKVGRGIENEARLQLFLGHLRRGLTETEAAERVKKFLFDYDNISVVEREVLSRAIPFYRWTRKNIALQAENLIKRPGRLATQIKPFRERGPENDALPVYLRGDLKVKVQSKGGKGAFLTGIDLPITDLDRIFTGDFKETFRQNLAQITPILKVWGELAAGGELFTGREFSGRIRSFGPVMEKAPNWLKEYLEFSKVEGREGPEFRINPTKAYILFRSYAQSRVFTSIERFARSDPETASWVVDFLTGTRFTEFDMTKAEERRIRYRIRQLETTLVNRGQLRRFQSTFVPKEQKER